MSTCSQSKWGRAWGWGGRGQSTQMPVGVTPVVAWALLSRFLEHTANLGEMSPPLLNAGWKVIDQSNYF